MRPPLDAYDVLIHLNPKQLPLLSLAVDPPAVRFCRGVITDGTPQTGGALPVIDYNPVTLYLTELRVRVVCIGFISMGGVFPKTSANMRCV